MIQGREKLGALAAELMEQFEEAEVEDGYEGRLGEVVIVAEVDIDKIHGADEDGYTAIRTRCTNGKQWIQLGLLEAGIERVHDCRQELAEEDD